MSENIPYFQGVPNTPIVFTDKVFVRPSSVQNVTTYIRMTGTAPPVLSRLFVIGLCALCLYIELHMGV